MITAVTGARDYSRLLELLTAREYVSRFEPRLFQVFEDINAALREDTKRAAAVAAKYGFEPAADGRYPVAIWHLSRSEIWDPSRPAAQ